MESALPYSPRPSHSYTSTPLTLQNCLTNEGCDIQNTPEEIPRGGGIRHEQHPSPGRTYLYISRLGQHIFRNQTGRHPHTSEQPILPQSSTAERTGSNYATGVLNGHIGQQPASEPTHWRDLAFAVSNSHLRSELHILLIFMILILAIVLSHSLIRFSMSVLRGIRTGGARNIPSRIGPNGYAQLERPIHVTLAGDEEILTENTGPIQEKVPPPPPAYGLWRSSVRINPDLLYWQRVNNTTHSLPKHPNPIQEESTNKPSPPRPPSYTSDNGIDYVIDAQPRLFAHHPTPEESGP
ncbi:hypothetical protein FE257_004089 [Aspergillus nanangensis]|uniref:Uncharacterized protein n=1 Tax=Aspergillus nanangensis TaxID=2582783 RepID=A0AAD4CAX9_ASPNN|nr:hypothetical protein FE257_004089 [Aspergillus nanangensis]